MSKSMEFCEQHIMQAKGTYLETIDFSKAQEIQNIESFVRKMFSDGYDPSNYELDYVDNDGDHIHINVSIQFDPDAEFDYMTCSSSTNDGTLVFLEMNAREAVLEAIGKTSYCIQKGKPQDGDHITYTLGNPIAIIEDGNFGTEEKPWMHSRFTVLLPVRYDRNGG